MRILTATLITLALGGPAFAQQTVSPLTGTTSAPPAAVTAPAAAPRAPRMTLKQRFEAANTTHDGRLTHDQAKAGHMPAVARHFDAIDTAKKGYVTVADIEAYNRAQRAARKPAGQ